MSPTVFPATNVTYGEERLYKGETFPSLIK